MIVRLFHIALGVFLALGTFIVWLAKWSSQ